MRDKIIGLVLLIFSAAIECWFLFSIILHPAGGWGASPLKAYVVGLILALLPLSLAAFFLTASRMTSDSSGLPIRAVIVAIVGPIFAWLGLDQYGHATVLFVLCGYSVQVACVANMAVIFHRGKAHASAR